MSEDLIKDKLANHDKRLDEHESQIKELSNVYIALTKVDNKVTNVESDVSEMKKDIKEIKEKPSKKMDQMWGYIVSAVIGALVTFITVRIGLK